MNFDMAGEVAAMLDALGAGGGGERLGERAVGQAMRRSLAG